MINTHVHPQIKLLTLTLRVTQKHAFSVHQIITPFTLSCVSLSKISCAKKKDMGYAKKREKKKIQAKRHERKKMHAKEHEEKKGKRKKEIKIAHTFK